MAGNRRGISGKSLTFGENPNGGAEILFVKDFDTTDPTLITTNLPYKIRVIGVDVICTETNGSGTATLTDGTNNISAAVTCDTVDELQSSATLDVTFYEVAKNGTLDITPANSAKGTMYVRCIKLES